MAARYTDNKATLTRGERGEQTRARLVESTIESIAVDGISGASVERITERAGVSRGLVRHYYRGKSQLVAAAFLRLADDYRAMLGIGETAPSGASPQVRLREAIVQAFERIRGIYERQYAWFGFWALARTDETLERINHELYDEVVDHLGGLVGAAAEELGHDIDATAAGRGVAALIEGAWLHAIIGVEGMSLDEAERICLDYAARLLSVEALESAR